MNLLAPVAWILPFAVLFGGLGVPLSQSFAQRQPAESRTNDIWLEVIEGTVQISENGSPRWLPTQVSQPLKPSDRLRTGPNSRIMIWWTDGSRLSLGSSSEILVRERPPGEETGFHVARGLSRFFHRNPPGRIRITTPGANAGIGGTEFVIEVDDQDRTRIWVIEGKVGLTNQFGSLSISDGEGLVSEPGKPPARTAGFIANNVLQWCLYYPAILDLHELSLSTDEEQALNQSLVAYTQGDLLQALEKYPEGRQPQSDAEKIYYAALVLSVGEVKRCEEILASLNAANPGEHIPRLAAALHQLIAAVKREETVSSLEPETATELLAASYYQQSLAIPEISLETALKLARRATDRSPQFGFAWARVAELEFSFGHTKKAIAALAVALALTPRNAEAISLQGFLLAAQNKTREAIDLFNEAISIDPGLGNAWLGRGLCRIRRGDQAGGRGDLLTAAALEPQRALLRSYLGKAYGNEGDFARAGKELELAKRLDINDPTSWLYSALLKQQQNRINEAIHDLEKSEELNDNRSVYRSQLLLDQDRAVRSANLAAIYRDAGMFDVSVREAARAVNYDYANYSAHAFLANSYSQGLDLVSRRFETAAAQEFLLANLLAPAGAGTLSGALSQSEYSRLFDGDHFGIVSSSEYLSRGAWTESGVQYGTFGNLSYDFAALYTFDPGQRMNNDSEVRQLQLQIKQQLTQDDSLYLLVSDLHVSEGDVSQFYDPSMAPTNARVTERQEPILGLGYRHEWSPHLQTLILATRIDDTFSLTNSAQPALLVFRPGGVLQEVQGINFHENLHIGLDIYSAELQQIWQTTHHTTILGTRFQYGDIDARNFQNFPSDQQSQFPDPPQPAADQQINLLFRRFTGYGYHQWQLADALQLIGGLSYDRITFPENFRAAPLSGNEETVDQVSPKTGFIWTPTTNTAVRFAYTRSLGGASLDQSYQLEPSQVAGFVQSYRSIIPESVAGANAGARFETFGLSLEQKLPSRTYIGITGQILNSEVKRTVGTFLSDAFQYETAIPSRLRENLDYQEQSLVCTVNQLLANNWSLGARYQLSHADLKDDFGGLPSTITFDKFVPKQHLIGVLHQLNLFAIYNDPGGFFTQAEANWYSQSNQGYTPDQPGDDFWQFNAFVGYRFPRRHAEVVLGLLNIGNQDYHLNPLNLQAELPHKRTLAVRFQLTF